MLSIGGLSTKGTISLIVRYESKPLEFAKGKNAIELAGVNDIVSTLTKLKEALEIR